MAWSTTDMKRDGQAEWLVRLYEKTVNAVRTFGRIPSEGTDGVMNVKIPTLADQARAFRYRPQLPPGKNVPTGQVEFLD